MNKPETKYSTALWLILLGAFLIIILAFFIMHGRSIDPPGVKIVSPITGLPQGTDGYPWWNDTVFYEIFIRSFYDSNDNGIGDINGIISKLDYLNDGNSSTNTDLGITGIWLMPIHPSSSYHGYDVINYMTINPEYGTLEDFKNLVDQAHSRGIRIIIDLVLNHTSIEHPWFIASRNPESEFRDYYVWVDEKPIYSGPWGQKVWIPHSTGYYYALFWEGMPDLNYTNSAVTEEVEAVVSYWLNETGIDGFRVDAARHLVEEGALQENTESTHLWYERFRSTYKNINPEAVTVGEIWDDLNSLKSYIQGDELDLAFQFGMADAFISSADEGNAGTAIGELRLTYKLLPPLQYAPFLANHDQNRTLSQLGGDINKAKVAASMLLTAPGVPFIYYGEEIGMLGEKPDEYIRRPMQWNLEKNGGFSADFPWLSLGAGWELSNVETESTDELSLLSHYRTLIAIRNAHAALRVGDTYTLQADNPALYGILRASLEETILVLINLSDEPISGYSLMLSESNLLPGIYQPYAILGAGDELQGLSISENGGFKTYSPTFSINAYETFIIQLQKND